jgi:phosphoglycolate phosphatase
MFDFDGVIADSLEIFYREYSAALHELGYHRLNSQEALLKLFDGNVIAQLIKQGFPVWKLKQLGNRFKPRITAVVKDIQPFPEMPEIVNALAAAHPVYIITSNVTSVVEDALARFGISGVLDVLGADKESSKVKKIKQVRKLHPAHTAWYIGDTKGDMLEGRSAGAITVATAWGWHDADRLASANPTHLLHQPNELMSLFDLGIIEKGET